MAVRIARSAADGIDLNAYDGFVTSNMAIVPHIDASIDAFAAGLTQLILDISSYFALRHDGFNALLAAHRSA